MTKPDTKNNAEDIKIPGICYVVGAFLIAYLLVAACIIIFVHLNFFETLGITSFLRAHILCGAFGMLGATLSSIRKYYKYLITHSTSIMTGAFVPPMDWSLGWVYYYISRPLLGSILGALTFLLSFIGFQVLAEPTLLDISSKGKYLLFTLAFLTGFSVSHVLDRLEAISKQIFQATTSSHKGG